MPTTTEPDVELVEYTVLVGAVSLNTGRLNPQTKKPEVVRALKGQKFNAPEDNPSVQTFLSMKSIRRTSEVTGKENVTARTMVKAFRDEVTAETVAAVAPLDAPMPSTAPLEAITAADIA